MPGGTGGGKASPPKMRLHRETHGGAVVYTDDSLRSPFLMRVRAVVLFLVGSVVLGLPFLYLAGVVIAAVGQEPQSAVLLIPLAWALGAALSCRIILLGPARVEWEPSAERKALVLRRVYPWGPPREKEFRTPEVEAVALLGRDQGGPYLQLELVLADGTTVSVEQGEELARMGELAREVGAALGLPVLQPGAVTSRWPLGRSLTRLPLTSGEGRWVDFDYGGRLGATVAMALAPLALCLVLLLGAGRVAMRLWTAPGPKSEPPLPGFLFCAGISFISFLVFLAFAGRLARDRYLGLRLSPKEGRVAFQQRTWSGAKREGAVVAGEIAGVLVFCNRKGEARQVWLEPKAGRRVYVDGGATGDLGQLAEELAKCLHAPVRREARSLFRL